MPMSVDKSGHDDLFHYLRTQRREKIRHTVEVVGVEAVNFVTSLTSRTKPGVRRGDGDRRMHPGNWADVTSNLVRSISHEVTQSEHNVVLTWGVMERSGLSGVSISDVMDYAERLDNMHGIRVLAGINRVIEQRVFDRVQRLIDQPVVSGSI